MDRLSFLAIYQSDPIFQTLSHKLHAEEKVRIQLKGLAGSLDMVVFAAYFQTKGKFHLIIAQDKEEAAYLNSDLQNLLGTEDQMIFPGSFKRPYEYDEVDNANVLMRAEILNQMLGSQGKPKIVITYPEALYEKVINKRSLVENTFSVHVGESVDMEFVSELLSSYDFERTDFVYEPGQFAIRGGILDVFSFSHDFPYRLELFGKEIESIRSFDPETQLSREEVDQIYLIPNIQTKLLQEVRQSLLSFLPEDTRIWVKDYQLTLDVMDECFNRAEQIFSKLVSQTGTEKLLLTPEHLFDRGKDFSESLLKFPIIEFGLQFYQRNSFNFREKK